MPFPSQADEARIWRRNRLRLFVSHASKVKTSGTRLGVALEPFGFDVFVAHEEPTHSSEWTYEIALALRSMHAFCAIVTPDFHTSAWCDQEVGFALGRPVPVLSIRSGATAEGLLGELLSIPSEDDADAMAQRMFAALVPLDSCRSLLLEGQLATLEQSPMGTLAVQLAQRLLEFKDHLSHTQIRRLVVAARDNPQVCAATQVAEKIRRLGGSLSPGPAVRALEPSAHKL